MKIFRELATRGYDLLWLFCAPGMAYVEHTMDRTNPPDKEETQPIYDTHAEAIRIAASRACITRKRCVVYKNRAHGGWVVIVGSTSCVQRYMAGLP